MDRQVKAVRRARATEALLRLVTSAVRRYGRLGTTVAVTVVVVAASGLGTLLSMVLLDRPMFPSLWLALGTPALLAPPSTYVFVTVIDELNAMSDRLRTLVETDGLTGACARRHFLNTAEHLGRQAERYSQPIALVLIDLDHFKRINDTYGHASGDAALRHFADICRAQLRDADVLGRLGGEEFAILMPQTGAAEARSATERLRRAVEATPFFHDRHAISMTASFGIAAVEGQTVDIETMLHIADQALYAAKDRGRNRVVGG